MIKEYNIPLYDINVDSIPAIIEKEKIDTYYTPMVNPSTIGNWNCNMVGTIHGLRSLETPADTYYKKYRKWDHVALYYVYKYFGKIYRKRKSAFLTKVLEMKNFYPVTVSRHSSYSIKVFFSSIVGNKKIPIFYSPSTNTGKDISSRKYQEKYFFLVSAFLPLKNCVRAIEALDRLFSDGCLDGFTVKVTGVLSPNKYRYKLKNVDKFEFLGYVDDVELEQLYHDAYCLVYPSLNEGFGYPPIEAMHYGVPVLASPFTSLTEVCGDAALYFNPFSVEEIMGRILYIKDEDTHAEYCIRSSKQYDKIHQKQILDLNELVNYIYSI